MYTDQFEYYRAESVDDAVALLAEHEDSELLAGAHGLLPRMRTGDESPPALVDIGHLDGLDAIERDGDALTVGALATHADVAASELVRRRASALADASAEVGDPQVRNGGTVGGNLAHGDPRSDPPAAVLALDGHVTVQGPDGPRRIDAAALFDDAFETSVGPHELVTALELPLGDRGSAYVKRRDPLSGYATVGVAASVRVEDGTVREATVAVTGAADVPFRLDSVEDALAGEPASDDAAADAAAVAPEAVDVAALRSDPQSSATYRAHLLSVYAERALAVALDRAV